MSRRSLPPALLADQLALYQLGLDDYPHHIISCPSYIQTFLRPCIGSSAAHYDCALALAVLLQPMTKIVWILQLLCSVGNQFPLLHLICTVIQRVPQRLLSRILQLLWVKPSLSMKILSINSFNIKLFSKFLSELSIGVHLKKVYDTQKFGSKVNHRQYFYMKNRLSMRNCLLITLL